MATATKKKTATKKAPARRRAVAKAKKRVIGFHPFAPGTKVGVYLEADIAGQRPDEEPSPKPLATATVKKDGSLEVELPKRGSYIVAGPVERYAQVRVGV